LPLPRAYFASRERYLKTPLRKNAFLCTHAASVVDYQPEGHPRNLRYQSDAWYCGDVPFGVVRFTTTVSDPRTGVVISRRDWQAVLASGILNRE
jgi:hypothetical protein